MRKGLVAATSLLATGGLLLFLAAPAFANSPKVIVQTQGIDACMGQWITDSNPPDHFNLRDEHNNNHYCYIKWDFDSNLSGGGRINDKVDDPDLIRTNIPVGSHNTIWWQLCEEESGGPDVCQPERSDST
jgi:hypothetical protein